VPKRTWVSGSKRQWSDLAILRTTPVRLGLFSLVTLFAHHLLHSQEMAVRQAVRYIKALLTVSDTLSSRSEKRPEASPWNTFIATSWQGDVLLARQHSTALQRRPYHVAVNSLAF